LVFFLRSSCLAAAVVCFCGCRTFLAT
jgi:hypothetical protein